MEQFNPNTYKKESAVKALTHSCLGRIIILSLIALVLIFIAAITPPSDSMMQWQMEDNILECLQSNDSIKSDQIDEYVSNIGRILTHADTTDINQEQYETYKALNTLKIYSHSFYKTAHIVNNIHPEGVRVGIGILGIVIPTIKYNDLLMNTGKVRGDYDKRLIRSVSQPEDNIGENPNVQPFHYEGNPDY